MSPTSERQLFNFAFVSNSVEIGEAVRFNSNPQSERLSVHQATMEQALPIAQELLDQGIEVILGGGGTGSLLAETIGQPIVKLPRSHIDVMRALIVARNNTSCVGLTTFAQPLDGIDVIEQLLSIRVRQIIFSTSQELETGIVEAMRDGVRCVVGGGFCRSIVNARGGVGIIAMPGRETILQALREARALAAARRREKRDLEQVHATLETMKDGVVIIDKNGQVRFFNSVAASAIGPLLQAAMAGSPPDELKAVGLSEVLRTGRGQVDQVHCLLGKDFVTTALPIHVSGAIEGAVVTFKEAARIQSIDRNLKERLYAKGFVAKHNLDNVKGDSPAMLALKERARRYADTDATILIEGETGCGKELLAQSLHNMSRRCEKPFVAINCSALPETLLESELFGYEEGAFTGAKRGGKVGFFELAHAGTLFLDEIADISASLQSRLLRVLEEKEIMRVGGDRILPIDVRIIASTYKNLLEEVRSYRFRSDLYFRLATLTLAVPPLRDRLEDLPVIVEASLWRHGKGRKRVSPKMIDRLAAYDWPGNLRELDSLIRRYVVLLGDCARDDRLFETLFDELRTGSGRPHVEPASERGVGPEDDHLKQRLEAFERELIDETLRACRFNKREAARRLGISANTLWRKLGKPITH